MSPRRSARLTTENILLALLEQNPMHGYELYQELSSMKGVSLIWNIKQSLLYAILDKMEGKGYLEARITDDDSIPRRKYFHVTDSGKKFLHDWLSTPVQHIRDIRQEFLAKLILLHRIGAQSPLTLIEGQLAACDMWLERFRAAIKPPDQETFDEWVVYSFRIQRIEGIIDWLKNLHEEFSHLDPDSSGR